MDAANVIERFESELAAFLSRQCEIIIAIDPALESYASSVSDYVLRGGKRIRPTFAYWGFRGAGGEDSPEVIRTVASLELLQAAALIHDDLIDDSDTRRGYPSIHRRFAHLHQESGWHGSAQAFGANAAILLGDLCFVWSDEMFTGSGMDLRAIMRARREFDLMRTEVSAGQYLDVLAEVRRDKSVETTIKVAQFKAAKYTVEQPLLIGASLAGAPDELRELYSALGLALGEAFQLRDDVLGVFGDPQQTGKPAGDDLREGKHTFLVAKAYEAASESQVARLDSGLGDRKLDTAGVSELRELLHDTGAMRATEQRISDLADQASHALEQARPLLVGESASVFARLLEAAVSRSWLADRYVGIIVTYVGVVFVRSVTDQLPDRSSSGGKFLYIAGSQVCLFCVRSGKKSRVPLVPSSTICARHVAFEPLWGLQLVPWWCLWWLECWYSEGSVNTVQAEKIRGRTLPYPISGVREIRISLIKMTTSPRSLARNRLHRRTTVSRIRNRRGSQVVPRIARSRRHRLIQSVRPNLVHRPLPTS